MRRRAALAAALALLCACGSQTVSSSASPRIAVLSAFPAEMAPLLAQATVESTVTINGHVFRVGVLGGVPVVIGLTGIGLLNAAATTHALLDQFPVKGIVVSAVAGSSVQIGDVVVPGAWAFKDGTMYGTHEPWIDLARTIAASGAVALERCADVPDASPDPVCMLEQPTIVVGGTGQSADSFGSTPFACQPNGGDIYGCDLPSGSATATGESHVFTTAAATAAPIVVDMETAAIAREAAQRGVPFIAFRAVSDGAGDPLGLATFLEFSAYYRFAAHNASLMTIPFLQRLAAAQ